MKSFFVKFAATGLGLGYSPIIPGTIGSLLGILIFFILIQFNVPLLISGCIIAALFFLGVITATKAEKIFNKKDPGTIVIDEVVGCLVYLYVIPLEIWCIILGFIIYRILDIIKPFPAGSAEELRGGWGIMLDDLIAGVYTGIIINIILWLKNWF